MGKLQEQIASRLAGYGFESSPGLALVATLDGQEQLRVELGKASLEYGIPWTVDTVSHAASIAKQFTAYAIALLLEERKLDEHARPHSLLPEFPRCASDITVSHLIHHTSGLRDQWDLLLMAGWRMDDVITSDQIWKMLLAQQALNFPAGAEMLYSNSGYSVLARIIEVVSGRSFEDFLRERVTAPLGLSKTFALVDHSTIVKNRAYGYKRSSDRRSFVRNDLSFANSGATSLFCSVGDLVRWAEYQNALNSDESSLGRRLLSRGRTHSGTELDYAYGAWVEMLGGDQIVYHDGWDAGYRAAVVRVPSRRAAIALLANGLEVPAIQLVFDALEELLGSDKWRPERVRRIGMATGSAGEQRPLAPPMCTGDVVGIYRSDELSTEYGIQTQGDELVLTHSRHPSAPLSRTEVPGQYTGPNWIPELTFQTAPDGVVSGFHVRSGRVRRVPFVKKIVKTR